MLDRQRRAFISQKDFEKLLSPEHIESDLRSVPQQISLRFNPTENSRNATLKVDFCIFLKTFYEQHLELDKTLRSL